MAESESLIRKSEHQFQEFVRDCGVGVCQGKKILEIGFKNGLFLEQCLRAGFEAWGLEINPGYHRRTAEKLSELNLILYDGRQMPIEDSQFDYVVSFQVLEHVESVEKVLSESLRVLKPGGVMYHIIPNYHSFYEGHHKVIWLPFLNKSTGRMYLKLIGKYRPMYETFNIIKPANIRRIIETFESRISEFSLGEKEFIYKFKAEYAEKIGQRHLRYAVKTILRTPVLKTVLLKFLLWMNLYYPITVIVKKKS